MENIKKKKSAAETGNWRKHMKTKFNALKFYQIKKNHRKEKNPSKHRKKINKQQTISNRSNI